MNDTTQSTRLLAVLAAAALIQGCGGGGSGGSSPSPQAAQAPRISSMSAVSMDQDKPGATRSFRVDDSDTPTSQLEVSVASSDPVLLPLRGIFIEGSGNERTLRIVPGVDVTGAGTLTLTVRDRGGLTDTTSVEVRVNPVLVAFSQVANSAFGAGAGAMPTKVSGVTVQPDVNDDPNAFDALLQQGAQ